MYLSQWKAQGKGRLNGCLTKELSRPSKITMGSPGSSRSPGPAGIDRGFKNLNRYINEDERD